MVQLKGSLAGGRGAWWVLGGAMLGAAAVIWLAGRGLVLSGDEWGYAGRLATEPTAEAILEPPPGKYLIALPLLLYEGLFATFGADSYLPYRLAGIALVLLNAGLVFEFTRRRAGAIVALAPAILLLVFGAAAEVVAQPVRLPSLFAVAGGIGAWLALDARTLRSDALASLLTLISVTSHPIGLAFAAGTVAQILLRRPARRMQEAWIFAVPLAVFTVWWLTARDPGTGPAPALADAVSFGADSLVLAAAAITGAFHNPLGGRIDSLGPAGWVATAVVLGVIAWGLARQREVRPELIAIAIALAIALVAPVFAPGEARSPSAGRYLYPTAILLLLLIAESLRGVRPKPGVGLALAVAAVLALSLHSNIWALLSTSDDLVARSEVLRGELTALDLARGTARDEFRPSEIPARPARPRSGYQLTALNYYEASAAFGSPAYTPSELARREPHVREIADLVLVSALRLTLERARDQARTRRPEMPPDCRRLRLDDHAPRALTLGPGSVSMRVAPGDRASMAVGRFAPGAVALGRIAGGTTARLGLPGDSGPLPWRLLIRGSGSVLVCGRTSSVAL